MWDSLTFYSTHSPRLNPLQLCLHLHLPNVHWESFRWFDSSQSIFGWAWILPVVRHCFCPGLAGVLWNCIFGWGLRLRRGVEWRGTVLAGTAGTASPGLAAGPPRRALETPGARATWAADGQTPVFAQRISHLTHCSSTAAGRPGVCVCLARWFWTRPRLLMRRASLPARCRCSCTWRNPAAALQLWAPQESVPTAPPPSAEHSGLLQDHEAC